MTQRLLVFHSCRHTGMRVLLLALLALAGACGDGSTEPRCPPAELPPGVDLAGATIRYTDDCVPFVRTPDERFANLPDFPFPPHYAEVDGLRMHYVDEGPRDGPVVLMLHGQPTWSYLYRKMIPSLAAAGFRAIAVDHVGMGRSDKPLALDTYRYLRHVEWIKEFMDVVGLEDVTLFCQDWGGLIGLRVVGDRPERFARVVVANTQLPVVPAAFDMRTLFTIPDTIVPDPTVPSQAGCQESRTVCFSRWIRYSLLNPDFRPSLIMRVAVEAEISDAELAAYDAPFPAHVYMAAPRTFPSLVVTVNEEPDNLAARAVFDAWEKPLLTIAGRLDLNLGSDATQGEMRDTVPGAVGQPHHAYPDAGHFLQEDKGADIARRLIEWMRD
ncbi:MAG: haloalkane dehalogenase [Candidatus Binatia bacterium]|nr:haloalkane dehalogenase [Candidatus Binatia bacterium]